jgi:hypothetical protein
MGSELLDIIAERELEKADDPASRVLVRIGRPVEDPEGDWRCPFQITGLGDDTVYAAFGIDSVQALALCLEMIRAQLADLSRGHRLTWLEGNDLGF